MVASIAVASFSLLAEPSLVQAQVTTVGNIATGTGNLSGGVTNQGGTPDFTTPPVDTLNINGLTQNIAPGAGTVGIEFFGPSIILNVDTGAFEIATNGAPALDLGSVTTNNLGITINNSTLRGTGPTAPLLRTTLAATGNNVTWTSDNSTYATTGNDSPLFRVDLGDTSILTATLTNSVFSSVGDNSGLIEYRLSNVNDATVTITDSMFSTDGVGSHAIFGNSLVDGGGSSQTIFFDRINIETLQDNSAGIITNDFGNASVRSTNGDDFTISTMGDNSPGIEIGDGDNGSVQSTTFANFGVTTAGDDSSGISQGLTDGGSAGSLTVTDFTIDTTGDRSEGLRNVGLGVGAGNASVSATDIARGTITTAGDDAAGLVFDGLSGLASTGVFSTEDVSITTQGVNSPGLVVGEQTAAEAGGTLPDNGSTRFSINSGTVVATNGDNSTGILINGLGDGVADADQTVFIEATVVTTQGENAVGVTLNTGSEGASNSLFTTTVDNVTVGTTGNGATGFILNSGAGRVSTGTSRFTTVIDNTNVTTSGDNADGVVLGAGLGEDDGNLPASPNPTNTLAVGTGVSATTSGANSHALVVSENTVLAMLSAGNPDSRIVNLDNFVATGSGSRAVQNNGTLQTGPTGEVFTAGTGARGNIANSGTIEGTGANALVYDIAANIDDIFELQPGGVVNGNVLAGNGNDQFVLGGEGTDAFDHSLIGTQYLGFDELIKEDSSIWTLNGPDTAAAIVPGTITGGTLAVESNLSAFDVNVQNGGTLAGSGGVGNLTSNGGFSPGGDDTAATFNVAGDIVFQTDSIFNVDIFADNSSDLVVVDGTATLGGTIAVNGLMFPAGFPVENDYTVLTSPGPVLGMFDSVVDNLPDIDAVVTVLPPTGPDDLLDPNQPGRVVVSYVLSEDTSDKAILSNSVQFAGQIGLAFAETMQRRVRIHQHCQTDGRFMWHQGIGGSHQVDDSFEATGYSGGYGGYAGGVERCIAADDGSIRYGIAGAYTGGGLTSGDSTADLQAGQIGTYASINMDGGLSFSTALGYGFLDYDIERGIPIAGGPAVIASGDSTGGVLAFSAAGSFNIAPLLGSRARGFRIAPIVRFDWLDTHRSAFSESGAALLDLDVSAANFDSGLVSYGLELGRRRLSGNGIPINALFDIRYEQLVGDRIATSTSVLQNVTGTPFTDPGALERDGRIAIGVAADIQLWQNASLHGRYDTAFDNNTASHRASGGLTLRF